MNLTLLATIAALFHDIPQSCIRLLGSATNEQIWLIRIMQKLLITIGLILVIAGFMWPWLNKLPFGKLPGDFLLERPEFRVYIPVTTMIIVSAVISIILWIFRR